MAYYTRDELQSIVLRLASEKGNVEFVKHEKLGVLFSPHLNAKLLNLYECNSCKKSVLSSHLLNLHVAEHHDTFFKVQKDRKPSVSLTF